MPAAMDENADTFDAAFSKAVDLGNKIAGKDKEADLWDIADGLLAGAIQYWLYSRQPCGVFPSKRSFQPSFFSFPDKVFGDDGWSVRR